VPAYYVLGCFGPEDADRASVGDVVDGEVSWQGGRRLAERPPTPVQVTLDPDYPGVVVPMFDAGILLFTDAMVEAIVGAGVDNLEVFPAVVRDPATGKTHTEYKAVNIVGAVSCADLAKSVYQAPSGTPLVDTDFDSLAIDERRTGGALMFRLAECVTAIVVHERVRAALVHAKIPHLDFYDPKQWIG
jgi:hypothetical protein